MNKTTRPDYEQLRKEAWTYIGDALPPEDVLLLATTTTGNSRKLLVRRAKYDASAADAGYFYDPRSGYFFGDDVIAWMIYPQPARPRKEQNQHEATNQ
jgi:hypothetical protein